MFNSDTRVTNFEEADVSYVCLSGEQHYANFTQIREVIGVQQKGGYCRNIIISVL